MEIYLNKTQKIIIGIVVGVLVVTGVVGGSIAIAKAAKRKQQAKCEHIYGEGVVRSEATCEQPGILVYTCEVCDYEQSEEIPANGHIETKVKAIPATCKAKGMTDGIQCVTCEKVLVSPVETPMLGHVARVLEGIANTCTTAGKGQGSQCTRCGEILKAQSEIPAKGHRVVEIKGHASTCMTEGATNGSKCADCGKIFSPQEVIPKVPHTGVEVDGKCDICGYVDVELLFAAYQNSENCTEKSVTIGESVMGKVYRIYKSESEIDVGMGHYGNRLYLFDNGTIGIGAKEATENVGAIAAWTTMEVTDFIYKDYGEYIDFYIAGGTYKIALGPYDALNDPDGDGYMERTVHSGTTIQALIGADRCFRLELT